MKFYAKHRLANSTSSMLQSVEQWINKLFYILKTKANIGWAIGMKTANKIPQIDQLQLIN